jgi:hypothetical protein
MIGLMDLHDLVRDAEKNDDQELLRQQIIQLVDSMPKLIDQISQECGVLEEKLALLNE